MPSSSKPSPNASDDSSRHGGKLVDAQEAFRMGNYALARKIALERRTKGEATGSGEAQLLLEQMSPAPLTKYLLLLVFLLLLAVTLSAYTR